MDQFSLDFGDDTKHPDSVDDERPTSVGKATVEYREVKSVLTKASGFMSDYDFTLNPYQGCSFGCTYCYAAFFARDEALRDNWGNWVHVKENAAKLIRRKAEKLRGKCIYMSSVTDPYQPIEQHVELVRDILALIHLYQPRLVIQTRGPLVTRDIDLFQKFEHIRVHMTITTDSEATRRVFEPSCPSNEQRLKAIQAVQQNDVPTGITLTPLLPVDDAKSFAKRLCDTGIQHFVVQPFHPEKGRFVRGTREEAIRLTKERGWTQERYDEVVEILKEELPNLHSGQSGFAPV